MKVKIAFIQLIPGKTIGERYETGQAACQKAKAMGADIALFPEMWSCGYYIPQDSNQLRALAITEQSDFVQGFSKTADKLNMAIGITFLEQNDPKPLNSMILFDRKGKKVLHYSKEHRRSSSSAPRRDSTETRPRGCSVPGEPPQGLPSF